MKRRKREIEREGRKILEIKHTHSHTHTHRKRKRGREIDKLNEREVKRE